MYCACCSVQNWPLSSLNWISKVDNRHYVRAYCPNIYIVQIGLQALTKLTNLEKFLLYHANNISSKDFRNFFNSAKLTKMTYVNLSGCKNINVSVEAIVRKSCPRVRRVIVGRRPIRLEEAYVDFGLYNKDIRNDNKHHMHFVSVQPLNSTTNQRFWSA